jgi:hypothetical protein
MIHVKLYFQFYLLSGWFSGRMCVSHSRSYQVSFFSLSYSPALQQQAITSTLRIINISFLSLSQHQHSRLNHFRIYFLDNKIKKIIV